MSISDWRQAKVAMLGSRAVLRVAGGRAFVAAGSRHKRCRAHSRRRSPLRRAADPAGQDSGGLFRCRRRRRLLIDCEAESAGGLAKRLAMYKLRAQVTISDVSGSLAVAPAGRRAAACGARPRLRRSKGRGLGWRAIAPHAELEKLGAPASEQIGMRTVSPAARRAAASISMGRHVSA